jgi:hypothetical protein
MLALRRLSGPPGGRLRVRSRQTLKLAPGAGFEARRPSENASEN